jgi:hypothetical protein
MFPSILSWKFAGFKIPEALIPAAAKNLPVSV